MHATGSVPVCPTFSRENRSGKRANRREENDASLRRLENCFLVLFLHDRAEFKSAAAPIRRLRPEASCGRLEIRRGPRRAVSGSSFVPSCVSTSRVNKWLVKARGAETEQSRKEDPEPRTERWDCRADFFRHGFSGTADGSKQFLFRPGITSVMPEPLRHFFRQGLSKQTLRPVKSGDGGASAWLRPKNLSSWSAPFI
jgi:hypothetical protein